jgi:formylmethanofuran dehydrogenase subunit E
VKISQIRENAKLREASCSDSHGEEVTCDACGEWVPNQDELAFWIEDDVVVCAWCLSDVEYDCIPPKCMGCGEERNMTRANEVQPGVYYCHLCLRTVYA